MDDNPVLVEIENKFYEAEDERKKEPLCIMKFKIKYSKLLLKNLNLLLMQKKTLILTIKNIPLNLLNILFLLNAKD